MNKLSDLIGMPVITLSTAEKIGTVTDLWFDRKYTALKTAEIFEENEDTDQTFFIPADKLRLGENAVILNSDLCIRTINPITAARNPVNSECYNHLGKSLGYVCDVILDGLKVNKIITDTVEFTPDKLLRSSDNVCVFNDTDKTVKLPKTVKRRSLQSAAPVSQPQAAYAPPAVAPTQPTPETLQQTAAPAQEPPQIETPALPLSVTVTHTPGEANKDYDFLLGKAVHSHIVSNGRILIPAGTVVDENVIEFARREKKLVRLALQAY